MLVFFDDLLGIAGESEGVGAVVVVVLLGLVLDDDGAAGFCVVEETVVEGLQLGTGGVGADAEDDGVVLGEIAGGDVLRGEKSGVDAEVFEDVATSSPVPMM